MNQSIQILDGYSFDAQKTALHMQALCAGMMLNCYVTGVKEAQAEAFYQDNLFELEERLTELLDEEDWNERGEVWLSASDI